MDTKRVCSTCGKPLAPGAPEGLCPKCLLKAGLGTGVDIEADTGAKSPRFTPPKIEELAAKFPQLEILEFIGQGGMGAVYKARQKQLDRVVALKILPPQAGGPAFAERFTREARALAKLNHPHIVTLYEFGQSDGLFYFLMEFVDGVNLRQLLSNSRISPREALAIVPQICEALQFAHDSGIVHRDIKPENVLLDKKGLVKIADFGVAKMIAESLTEAAGKSTSATGELTEAGSTLGTPQYMAPEQIKNSAEVDHRADIYSLGVVFYQMLTGELPSGKIEPPSRKVQIDVRLDEVVLRALEKKPELRFQQASDIKTVVETIATTPGSPAPKAPPGFKHYKDFAWNFELDIPEGWNKYPPIHTNSPWELLRFASHESGSLTLYRMPHDPAKPLKDISDVIQKILAKAGYGNFLTSETTIGGKPVRTLDFDRSEGEGIWSYREYIMAEGTLAYVLRFGASDKAAMFETFDRMAKSFRFQAPPPTVPGLRRYKNPEWNFELDIPGGWNTFPPVLSNSIHEKLRFASHENGRHALIVFQGLFAAKSLKAMSDGAQNTLAKAGFGNFVSAETTIGGKPALTLDFDRPEGDGTWSCRHYFIAEGMQVYTLGFGTTDKAAMFEIFDRMARSFQFEGPSYESRIHPFSLYKGKLEPLLPTGKTVPAEEPKPEPSGQKAETERSPGYTVRIEPVNPEPARRLGMTGLIAFLAIIVAAIGILLFVRTSPPKAQHQLSEAAFLQKFNSNQVAQATITYPTKAGDPATISGKYFDADTNGNIMEQNGQPVEEAFIAPAVLLTPALEEKLLRSKNITVNIPNPMVSGIGFQLLFLVLLPFVLLLTIVLAIYFFVRKTRGPPVIPGAGAASASNRQRRLKGFLIAVLVIIPTVFAILFSAHKGSVNANLRAVSQVSVLFHVRVFEADAGLVDQLIPAGERQSGVQPNVKSAFPQGMRETSTFSQGNFHMTTHNAETESQFAPVSPAVVHALLKGIAAYPGVLVDLTNLVSGIWSQPPSATGGLPLSWNYSVARNSMFGNGSGSALCGVQKENGVTDVRVDGELRHSINILLPDRSYTIPDAKNSRFLYEGPLPQTNELIFLVPFLRNDGSQHYLVTGFDFNGQNNEEIPIVPLNGPPFTAQLHQATVELVAVGDGPWTNHVCWYPNGKPSPKAFPTGQQDISGYDTNVKKIVFYVRNQSTNGVSMPICHVDESWPLNASSTWLPPYEGNHNGYFGLALGVPTNATMANLSIGVANEPWETVISMDHPPNGIEGNGTGENNWSGTYKSVIGANGDVAVACTYTTRSNWVSRIVYVNNNGKIVPIDERSDAGFFSNPATGTLLISSNEFVHIRQFLVQRRKCQWVDFDNVSLQQGHLTSVTAKVY